MSAQSIVSNVCVLCDKSFKKTRSETCETVCCGYKFHSNCLDKIEGDECPCCSALISRSLKFRSVESKSVFALAIGKCKLNKCIIKSYNQNISNCIKNLKKEIDVAKREMKVASRLVKKGEDVTAQSVIIDNRTNTARDLTEKRNNFILTLHRYNSGSIERTNELKRKCCSTKNEMTSIANEIQVKKADRKLAKF